MGPGESEGGQPLWPLAAEIVATFRSRYERLNATVNDAGKPIDHAIRGRLAAMDDAVAAEDLMRLTAMANDLLTLLDQLESARRLHKRRETTSPDLPIGPGSHQPPATEEPT